jgi:glucokinase
MSIERVCAGPAVPMIYEFYKEINSVAKTDCVLENGDNAKTPDQITAEDIVNAAFNKENPDKLCRQVVEKFAEILAVEVGNHALKTLPYGGIFLIGGVT